MRKEVLEQKEFKKETKLRVFNVMVVFFTNAKRGQCRRGMKVRRLQACEIMCLRRIECVWG